MEIYCTFEHFDIYLFSFSIVFDKINHYISSFTVFYSFFVYFKLFSDMLKRIWLNSSSSLILILY